MKKIGIYFNNSIPDAEQAAEHVKTLLEKKGADCRIVKQGDDMSGTDCLIILGGDGTVLRASKLVKYKNIPVLGINMGTVGYLTESGIEDAEMIAERLMDGEYSIETRRMLDGKVIRDGKVIFKDTALNDIFFERRGPLMVVRFQNYVNGEYLNSLEGDGEIISTATGSTAYSLSAGGPIVTPESRVKILTPVCAHALKARSIILKHKDNISVVMAEGRSKRENVAAVRFDGGEAVLVRTGDRINISTSRYTTKFIKVSNRSFLEVLRIKFSENSFIK